MYYDMLPATYDLQTITCDMFFKEHNVILFWKNIIAHKGQDTTISII